MKNFYKSLILCFIFSFCFVIGCDNNPPEQSQQELKTWFTEDELKDVGLMGLKAPILCNGDISIDNNYFFGKYYFSQLANNEQSLEENANIILNYFIENYNNKFGIAKLYATNVESNIYIYNINLESDLEKFFDDNPSPLYKFFYIINDETDKDGYIVNGGVYSLEIRYENEKILILVDDESTNYNGTIQLKYKLNNN